MKAYALVGYAIDDYDEREKNWIMRAFFDQSSAMAERDLLSGLRGAYNRATETNVEIARAVMIYQKGKEKREPERLLLEKRRAEIKEALDALLRADPKAITDSAYSAGYEVVEFDIA